MGEIEREWEGKEGREWEGEIYEPTTFTNMPAPMPSARMPSANLVQDLHFQPPSGSCTVHGAIFYAKISMFSALGQILYAITRNNLTVIVLSLVGWLKIICDTTFKTRHTI